MVFGMEMGLAIGADIVTTLYWTLGILAFIGINGLIGAVWLRLAGRWLQFHPFPFTKALIASITASFVVTIINFSICFQNGFFSILFQWESRRNYSERLFDQMQFLVFPSFLLSSLIFCLILTAALFSRILSDKAAESSIKFCDGLALAGLYYCMSFAFMCFPIISLLVLHNT